MRTVPAGSFKTKCPSIVDEVRAKHETAVITKHGKPVAKLVPVSTETYEIYNFPAGKGTIAADVVSPAVSPQQRGELSNLTLTQNLTYSDSIGRRALDTSS